MIASFRVFGERAKQISDKQIFIARKEIIEGRETVVLKLMHDSEKARFDEIAIEDTQGLIRRDLLLEID